MREYQESDFPLVVKATREEMTLAIVAATLTAAGIRWPNLHASPPDPSAAIVDKHMCYAMNCVRREKGEIRRPFVGDVAIYPTGTNRYDLKVENKYLIGEERAAALRAFRDTGSLPEGFSLWCDLEGARGPILSPSEVDWTHMRDE